MWSKWVEKYLSVRDSNAAEIRNPRYVLLNYIARQLK